VRLSAQGGSGVLARTLQMDDFQRPSPSYVFWRNSGRKLARLLRSRTCGPVFEAELKTGVAAGKLPLQGCAGTSANEPRPPMRILLAKSGSRVNEPRDLLEILGVVIFLSWWSTPGVDLQAERTWSSSNGRRKAAKNMSNSLSMSSQLYVSRLPHISVPQEFIDMAEWSIY
jgi:hypothetical protein